MHGATCLLTQQRPSLRGWGITSVFLFAYTGIQCPMQAISHRRAMWHDGLAGAIVGYFGVQSGWLRPLMFAQTRAMRPPVAGAATYGIMGLVAGLFQGKGL